MKASSTGYYHESFSIFPSVTNLEKDCGFLFRHECLTTVIAEVTAHVIWADLSSSSGGV